jgi:hypothetical protein
MLSDVFYMAKARRRMLLQEHLQFGTAEDRRQLIEDRVGHPREDRRHESVEAIIIKCTKTAGVSGGTRGNSWNRYGCLCGVTAAPAGHPIIFPA